MGHRNDVHKCHYANQNGNAIQNQGGGERGEGEGDGERALLNKAI